MVLAESAGNFKAVRYEPHQDRAGRTDQRNDPDTPGVDDKWNEDDKSYGLMQVMGYNIRALLMLPRVRIDYGFALEPAVNLSLGVTVLHAELRSVGGNYDRALARYNGGPTGDDGWPGEMRLERYVARIVQHAQAAMAERKKLGWPVA